MQHSSAGNSTTITLLTSGKLRKKAIVKGNGKKTKYAFCAAGGSVRTLQAKIPIEDKKNNTLSKP